MLKQKRKLKKTLKIFLSFPRLPPCWSTKRESVYCRRLPARPDSWRLQKRNWHTCSGDGTAYAEELGKRLNAEDVRVYGNFGTANFKFGDYSIEFVAARKESYSKESRNPEVTPATFEEDISRRDFTINAIAASVNSENFGKLFDLFNGLQDIKDKLIRTP